MRAPKASIYHIAQSGKNKGMPAVCRAAPGKCPLTTSDGQPAPHYRTREEAAEHAAVNFPAFTKTTPQWALEENALKHPILDGETVGGWATTLPEQTLHAWLDQQTKDGAPASNPTADDILAYAPEGSYARHCALIEKAAQDGLNGRLGLEGEYADNRHQLLAYRDGLARAGHEKAAQAIPVPGEWTRPANPDKGEEDGPRGVIVGNSAGKTIIKTSWGVKPGMTLPTENEAYRVDTDNGDGTYTCTPYWAAPQPAHHRPDGTLTQAGEASVKRRMSAPTMTRPDHITLPNGGESVQAGQRIRVKHGRTGRISVVEVVAASGGGPDVTASYADAATYKVKTLRNTLTGGKWRRKSGGQYLPHHPDARAGDLVKIKRRDGAVSTILLGGEKNRDGTWSDYTDVTPTWKKATSPVTWQDEWRVKAPVHRSGDIITVLNKSGRAQNVILAGHDEESGTFGTARPTVEDYDSHLCDVETSPGYGR